MAPSGTRRFHSGARIGVPPWSCCVAPCGVWQNTQTSLVPPVAACVLPVVAGEILLRGFALPALGAWKGPVPAALVVSVVFGGLAASRSEPAQFAGQLLGGGLSDLRFGPGAGLRCALTQGCQAVVAPRRISQVEGPMVLALDGEPALPRLLSDLGLDPNRLYVTVFMGNDDSPVDEESIAVWKEQYAKVGIKAEVCEYGTKIASDASLRIFTLPAKDS